VRQGADGTILDHATALILMVTDADHSDPKPLDRNPAESLPQQPKFHSNAFPSGNVGERTMQRDATDGRARSVKHLREGFPYQFCEAERSFLNPGHHLRVPACHRRRLSGVLASIITCVLILVIFLPAVYAQAPPPLQPAAPAEVVGNDTNKYGVATLQIAYNFPDTEDGGLERLIIVTSYDLDFSDNFYMETASGTMTWSHDLTCHGPNSYEVFISAIRVLPNGQYVPGTPRTSTTITGVANSVTVSIQNGDPDDTGHLDVSLPFNFIGTPLNARSLELWIDNHDLLKAPDSLIRQEGIDSGAWNLSLDTACMNQGHHTLRAVIGGCTTREEVGGFDVDHKPTAHPMLTPAFGPNGEPGYNVTIGYDFPQTNNPNTRSIEVAWAPTDKEPAKPIVTYLPIPATHGTYPVSPDVLFIAKPPLVRILRVTASVCGESVTATIPVDQNSCKGPDAPSATCNCNCINNPVRVSNGNMRYTEQDPLPNDTGIPFTRTYDSSNAEIGAFGLGWSSPLDAWMTFDQTNDGTQLLILTSEMNDEYVFVRGTDPNSFRQTWPTGDDVDGTLTFDPAAGTYTHREARSNVARVYKNNRVVSLINVSTQRRLDITRNETGGVTRIADSWGRFAWTVISSGSVIVEIQVEGRPDIDWNYQHNGNNLVRVTLLGTLDDWRTYEYENDLMTFARDARGALIESHTYDAAGRATSSIGPGGDTTNIQYQQNSDGTITTSVTGANGRQGSYTTANVNGRDRTTAMAAACTSCSSSDSRYLFDDVTGKLIRQQNARGYITEYSYPSTGMPRIEVVSEHLKPFGCDPATDVGRCLNVTLTPGTELTPESKETLYTYGDPNWPDKATEIRSQSVAAVGQQRIDTFTFDPVMGMPLVHSITAFVSPSQSETRTTVNALYDGSATAAFNPGGAFTTAWAELPQPNGLMKSVTGPRTDVADVTTYVYYPVDASVPATWRGLPAAVRNPAGHIVRFENYDVFGRPLRVIDANGVVTESTYDALGRLLTSTVKGVSECDTTVDSLCGTDIVTPQSYTSSTGPLAVQTSPSGGVTTYEYDDRGRVLAVNRGPSVNDLRERMEYQYGTTTLQKVVERYLKKDGGAWTETKREAFQYDLLDRLSVLDHPDGTKVVYAYDPLDHISGVQDENHSAPNTGYSYDSADRLKSVSQLLAGAPGGQIATQYAYDLQGNLTSVTDPNGNLTSYVIDDFGQMRSQTSPVTGLTTYSYDLGGDLVSTTDGNGANTSRTFDALGRVVASTSTRSGATPETVYWAYDTGTFGVGRLATMTDPTGTTSYAYSRRGQLLSEVKSAQGPTNGAPSIDTFSVVPGSLQIYAGNAITIDASASDDVAVTSVTLTSSVGTVTSNPPVTSNGGRSWARSFSLNIPVSTPGGTSVQLSLTTTDNSSVSTTQQKIVTILADTNPPTINVSQPANGQTFEFSSVAVIPIRAVIADAEFAVDPAQVFVSLGGATTVAMAVDPATPNGWKVDLPVPAVNSSDPVPMTVVITAKDYQGNIGTSAALSVNVQQPFVDPNGPVVAWICPTDSGAMFPAGYSVTVRASAVGVSSTNSVSSVDFYVGDSTTPVAGTLTGGAYQATVTLPDGADGSRLALRAVATSTGGNRTTADIAVTIVTGTTVGADTTLAAGDLHLDNQTVAVTGGTLTIAGTHHFTRLLVLDGATVTHLAMSSTGASSVDISADAVYVSCGGAIDVSGRGYGTGVSYPGEVAPGYASGGSHIGVGGFNTNPLGTTYGSIERPAEGGGGSGVEGGVTEAGGGIVRIMAGTLTNDGAIRANGQPVSGQGRSGAGGSIWITATNLSGDGTIETNGADGSSARGGGGGAISIEYQSATGTVLTKLSARTGTPSGGAGGAGTVYLKGPQSTYGDVTVDNKGNGSEEPVDFPSLGSGVAQAGSTGPSLVTDRATNVPAYFVGHWVEVKDSSGTLKGTWRIGSIDATNAKQVTLAPNSSETVSVQPGDTWQGVYRFDSLHAVNGETIHSNDPIRLGVGGIIQLNGPATAGQYLELSAPIVGTDVTVTGNVSVPGISATTLTVKSGATLTVPSNSTSPNVFALNVSSALTIESGGAIDVSGRGYGTGVSYPGEVVPGYASGGSHIGVGALYYSPLGTSYGSIERPGEAGGGAGVEDGVTEAGGGIVRIVAGTLANDGAIRANGQPVSGQGRSGAGGSIWITATNVGGAGTIETNGGDASSFRSGGGGAISLEYQSATGAVLTKLSARTGAPSQGLGGAGTVYLKGPQSTYGDVTVDNKGNGSEEPVDFPSFGSGVAQAGSTGPSLVTDRATNIPAYFVGHWVEVKDSSGTLKGTWRIASIDTTNAKQVTLAPNSSETVSVQPGDTWQGVYRFDSLHAVNGETIHSNDPIRLGVGGIIQLNGPTTAGQYLELSAPIVGTDVTVTGNVSVPGISATTLTVKSGATLTVPSNSNSPTMLSLNVSSAVTIESGGAIDVSGRGYGTGVSYPGEVVPGYASGGSHIGVGALYYSPLGTSYGSIERPGEAGGGAGVEDGVTEAGGGIVRIVAGTLANDGAIRANGQPVSGQGRSGAGGSIWITATNVGGAGTIETNGGDASSFRSGGGGAISLEYQSATGAVLTKLSARTGAPSQGLGGAGTVYLKGPQSTYGDVTVDNKGNGSEEPVDFPSFGSGVAQAGSTGPSLVTDRATNIPAYFVGHWVEVKDSSGTLKGTWRIASIDTTNAKQVTLAPNSSETVSVQPGDTWQGVYRFDSLHAVNGETIHSNDPIRLGVGGTAARPGTATLSQIVRLRIQRSLVSIETRGGMLVIRGGTGAVLGAHPISVEIDNNTLGTTVAAVPVANDGSFEANVAGASGDRLTMKARDGTGEEIEVGLGRVPVSIASAAHGDLVAPSVTPGLSPPPALRIERSLISIAKRGATFYVRGQTGAVVGAQPISVEIRNLTLGTSVPGVAVRKDGAFETTIPAGPGDNLAMKAISGIGEEIEIGLGQVPATEPHASSSQGRSLAVDGLHLVSNLLSVPGHPAPAMLPRCEHCSSTEPRDQSRYPAGPQSDKIQAVMPRVRRKARPRFNSLHETKDLYVV
jgi:YD repeat-containing protein